MTRSKRKFVVGLCIGLVWSWFTSYLWWQQSLQFDPTGRGTATYGSSMRWRWLSVHSSGGAAAVRTWDVNLVGVGFLLLVSTLLGIVSWLVWRWLVRNSALQGVCDRCGYRLVGTSAIETCPECGEASSASDRRLQINVRSSRMLFTALALAGIGAIGTTAPILAYAAVTFHLAANPGQPAWKYVEWSGVASDYALYVFLFAVILLAIWLYLEPSKHHKDRART